MIDSYDPSYEQANAELDAALRHPRGTEAGFLEWLAENPSGPETLSSLPIGRW